MRTDHSHITGHSPAFAVRIHAAGKNSTRWLPEGGTPCPARRGSKMAQQFIVQRCKQVAADKNFAVFFFARISLEYRRHKQKLFKLKTPGRSGVFIGACCCCAWYSRGPLRKSAQIYTPRGTHARLNRLTASQRVFVWANAYLLDQYLVSSPIALAPESAHIFSKVAGVC